MNSRVMQVGLVLLGLIVLGFGAALFLPGQKDFRGTLYDPPLPAAEIELLRDDGSNFRLSEQRGNVVLLFFGYTSCPDVCPTTLSELRMVREELGKQADQVQVVFVTVDPQRDTPQVVQKYVSIFNPDFIGLSGTEAALAKVWNDYGVYREVEQTESLSAYLVNHTARVYLIDAQGNMKLSYSFGTPVDDIVHDLEILFE